MSITFNSHNLNLQQTFFTKLILIFRRRLTNWNILFLDLSFRDVKKVTSFPGRWVCSKKVWFERLLSDRGFIKTVTVHTTENQIQKKNTTCLKNSFLQTGRDQDLLSVESVYVQTVNTGHVYSNGHVPVNGHVPSNGHVAHHTDLQTIYGTVQQVYLWPTRPLSNTDWEIKWNASFSFRFSPPPPLWQSLA